MGTEGMCDWKNMPDYIFLLTSFKKLLDLELLK